RHPSAEDVYKWLNPANPSISLGTVYKTLDSFVASGLICKVLSENDSRRYDDNCQAHNHIYCTNTQEIIDYHDPELEALLADFFRKRNIANFNIGSIAVQITGAKQNPEKQVTIKPNFN
ncbi:MAG: transcriptional repressor, partial [Hymenobacteraceae bacterium]|nr:transcriptional repressor [Hymenobacteraceae bacterium]MDX5396383.1 transcriptional repressor [Hymenobacteraceae bacterium]MDX5512445.1 transcriptional repressor [Hymenobacteraceae bacterium]